MEKSTTAVGEEAALAVLDDDGAALGKDKGQVGANDEVTVLGNVAEIQNFPTCHQELSMERPATRGRRVHLHTLVDRYAEAFKRTGLMESYSS